MGIANHDLTWPGCLDVNGLIASAAITDEGDTDMEGWEARNAQWVEKLSLKIRDRVVPDTAVVLGVEPGAVYPTEELPEITIAPGVTARASWGQGSLLETLAMEPGAEYPEHELTGEVITRVLSGSATCGVDGRSLKLDPGSVLYLTEDTKRTLRTGSEGLRALEVFSPVRVDHLNLAGVAHGEDADVSFPDQGVEPSLEPGVVYAFDDMQRTPIVLPGMDADAPTAHARFMWGRNVMLSFVSMAPDSSFPMHLHPEDQLMIVLRGAMEEGIIDTWLPMKGDSLDVILQPGGMIHGARMSPLGADVLDVVWPVRPDYVALHQKHASRS